MGRFFVAVNTEVIAVDSVEYVRLAKAFASGDYMGALDVKRPPLYPALMGLASFIIPDLPLAGRLVSLVFGALTAVLVYFWAGGFSTRRRASSRPPSPQCILTCFVIPGTSLPRRFIIFSCGRRVPRA